MQTLSIWSYKIYISEKQDWNARNFDDFFVCKQVHWNEIFLLENNDKKNINSDWIITDCLHTKIWGLTADCNGIILMWKKYFGVVHAGRKWLKKNIVSKWIKILQDKGEKKSEIIVFIWPSIKKCCYEVWDEFLDYFDKKYFTKKWQKHHFDMIEFLYDQLTNLWIDKDKIKVHEECTKCWSNFFSYRNWDLNDRIIIWVEKN